MSNRHLFYVQTKRTSKINTKTQSHKTAIFKYNLICDFVTLCLFFLTQ